MKNLIFVSYFSSIQGMVMAEWADDKLSVASSSFERTFLVTSIASEKKNHKNVVILRVPSLSWQDFSWELNELRNRRKHIPISIILYYPIPFIFGRIWDYLFAKVAKNSAARWSWAFSALPATLFLKIANPFSLVFCTGGATGGHLLGLLTKYFTRTQLFFEFQDPLLGSEMQRSSFNMRGILGLERKFVSNSVRSVFVTKNAADAAKKRHPELIDKILSIYPGASRFPEDFEPALIRKGVSIELIHMGTLYGARNLDNFFQAIDNLKRSGYENLDFVRILNLGAVYLENEQEYLARPDFQVLEVSNRRDALLRASKADALLLIQHSDSRSHETIPYKTYDYFNLTKPIFAVINNQELAEMLDPNYDFVSDSTSVESIQSALLELLEKQAHGFGIAKSRRNKYDIEQQFSQIFESSPNRDLSR
jgi:hypothetical protein